MRQRGINLRQMVGRVTADFLQARFTAEIALRGEYVTVTRKPATQGGSISTQSLVCLPQPLSWVSASHLNIEGTDNLAEAMPHNFIFQYMADVQATLDFITYNGWYFRCLTAIPNRLGGVTQALEVLGVRVAKLPT